MKAYVFLIFLFIDFGCRSSRSTLDTSFREDEAAQEKKATQEKIYLQKDYLDEQSSVVNTNMNEHLTSTRYNPNGSVAEVTERWRGIEQGKMFRKATHTATDSVKQKNEEISSQKNRQSELQQEKTSVSDSRLIQGWKEWGIVLAAIAGLVLVILSIRKLKHFFYIRIRRKK